MSTWFITGCSTGLGRHLALAVLGAGHNAVVTARDAATVADLVEAHPDKALALALDVTDPTQIGAAVNKATERFGTVDVLVNNAGYGYRGAVEEGEDDGVGEQFATNFFGPVNLIKAVLPGMRAARNGTIVNISSISAQIGPPGSGYYSSSKAALEALSASLRKEVGPLGISVIVVEPGAFRTDFAGRSLRQRRDSDRRLRRHRRQATQGERHRPRHPTRRPGQGRAGHHHRRRVADPAVLPPARKRRARYRSRGSRRAPRRDRHLATPQRQHRPRKLIKGEHR